MGQGTRGAGSQKNINFHNEVEENGGGGWNWRLHWRGGVGRRASKGSHKETVKAEKK